MYTQQSTQSSSCPPSDTNDFAIQSAGHSAIGRRHAVNEDVFFTDDARGIYIVADGMGGQPCGHVASGLAVDALVEALPQHWPANSVTRAISASMHAAFLEANRCIVSRGLADPKLFGMGTTAVMVVTWNNLAFVGSLGDSRAYLLRRSTLWQYTIDHTMAQALAATGVISPAAAQQHRWRNQLWQFLGKTDLKDGPEISVIRLEAGDRLLLVSDGVHDVLDRNMLTEVAGLGCSPAIASRDVITAALTAETTDDATCVVVDIAARNRSPSCTARHSERDRDCTNCHADRS